MDFADLFDEGAICGRVGWSKECCMGITVKHVVVAAVIFAVIGFGYVIGFAEIDAVRSPRAGAIGARASFSRLVTNVRYAMASGQDRRARDGADELVAMYPAYAQSWLYRGMVNRYTNPAYLPSGHGVDLDGELDGQSGGRSGVEGEAAGLFGADGESSKGVESWEHLLSILGERDLDSLDGTTLRAVLYQRGWAKRGLGRMDEARADFLRLARLMERAGGGGSGDSAGPVFGGAWRDEDGPVIRSAGVRSAYDLACYWALAGRFERALDYWRVCVEGGYDLNGSGGWWRVDPDFEDLWDDERFWGIAGE
jgi:hypothetical protein